MQIDWPEEFRDWIDRVETKAQSGDRTSRTLLAFALAALRDLQDLERPPSRDDETLSLRWVRQSRRHQLWRTSHRFHPEVAVRLICWFPPDAEDTVVVTLLGADKGRMGAAFYDTVGERADLLIDHWTRQKKEEGS